MPTLIYPKPDPAVLYYKKPSKMGGTDIAIITTIADDGQGGWRAHLYIPGMAPEWINHTAGNLQEWEAVYAVTDERLEEMVVRIAQKVVEILQDEMDAEPADIVGTAMKIVTSGSVEEALSEAEIQVEKQEKTSKREKKYICGSCNKQYAYERALKSHVKRAHKQASNA
tara:strand:- start:136 stop:642 length:507 start_codon:yes stop_codon:yes gene_type:complete